MNRQYKFIFKEGAVKRKGGKGSCDWLMDSSYITGLDGEVTQNFEIEERDSPIPLKNNKPIGRQYFPSGEVFVENHQNSYNTPYKFNGKELDHETGYYYYGARYYNPKTSLFLGVDPLVEQTMQPYTYANNNPLRFIDPTGMASKEAGDVNYCSTCPNGIYIPIADHVYTNGLKAGMKSSNGWEVKNVDIDPISGFVGALYEGTYNGKTEYIYATRGTDPTSLKDWTANVDQLFGASEQIKYSIGIAEKIVDNYPGTSFTGHSEGGAESSANALYTGSKAVSFNPAYLSEATKKMYNLNNKNASITSIIVSGEILSFYQDNTMLKPEGKRINIPSVYNNTYVGRILNHSMDSVKASWIKYQKQLIEQYKNRK